MPKVTYGADPEFFVQERATGTIIPACGLFGGDKGAPILLSSMGGYLEDGVAIEFNVAPADNIEEVRQRLLNLVSMWEQRFPQHKLVSSPYADFDKKTLRTHKKAMEIGCTADLCAWGLRRAPQIREMAATRYAGGHIHVGIDPWPDGLEKAFVIRWLDAFAWTTNLADVNEERFKFYGRPGLYRDTHYGVEYRSPDPTWVFEKGPIAAAVEKSIGNLMNCWKHDSAWTKQCFDSITRELRMDGLYSKPTFDTLSIPRAWRKDLAYYAEYMEKQAA